MLVAVSILLIFTFIVNTLLRGNRWYSPISLFSLMWAIILLFYEMRIYPIYNISIRGQSIITLGVVSFLVGSRPGGYSFGSVGSALYVNSEKDIDDYSVVRVKKYVYFMAYICIILLAIEAAQSIALLAMGMSFHDITLAKEYYIGGTAWTFFQVYFSGPFSNAILPIGALNFIKTGGDKKIAILSIVICVLKVLHHGGRATVIYFIIYLILFKSILGKKINLKLSTKIWMVLVSISAIILVVIISMNRGIEEFGKSAYLYLCGAIPDMDLRLEKIIESGLTLGTASLYGYVSPIMFIYKGIFNTYPSFFVNLQNIVNVESIVQIGPGVEYGYNAFVTPFYYFFSDAREFGVVVGSFLWGIISQRKYKNVLLRISDKNLVVYSLFFFQIVFSMIRFQFSIYQFALSFFYVWLIYRNIE